MAAKELISKRERGPLSLRDTTSKQNKSKQKQQEEREKEAEIPR